MDKKLGMASRFPWPVMGILTSVIPCLLGHAQDLDNLNINKGIGISGSLNLNTIAYGALGTAQRRDPFNAYMSGNLSVNLFGYDAPFSFSYSNTNRSFTQPFNQFSFSPRYKWVKTYLGHNAMSFSPYTYAGHLFFGGGIELSPGKWRIAAFYGKLRKAIPFVIDSVLNKQPAYKRMGYGIKVGYENKGDNISANLFYAKDDTTSLPFVLPESGLTPKENTATALTFRKRFLKHFFMDGEYALSFVNPDIRLTDSTMAQVDNRPFNVFLSPKIRTYHAAYGGIGFEGKAITLRLRYERIDPEYQTLGAYYFNNDMENITIAPTLRLFKNKLTLNANSGLQRNNLDQNRNATTRRLVTSFQTAYVPNETINLSANYSNFSTYTNIRPQADPYYRYTPDTLDFYQINQTIQFSFFKNWNKENRIQSFMANFSYQKGSDKAAYMQTVQGSSFHTANLTYSRSWPETQTTASLSSNFYNMSMETVHNIHCGPSLNLAKSFSEKKLTLAYMGAYNWNLINGMTTAKVMTHRIHISLQPKPTKKENGHHIAGLSMNVMDKSSHQAQTPSFTELMASLTYTYSFD